MARLIPGQDAAGLHPLALARGDAARVARCAQEITRLTRGPCRVELDGQIVEGGLFDLVDDGREHQVRVTLLVGDLGAR